MRTMRTLTLAAVLGLALATPSIGRVLEPMVVGWERIFKLDYEAKDKAGRPVVSGYVHNDSPYTIARVQLLVEGLDRNGAILGQRVDWVPGALTPFSRAYFESPAPQRAPQYRVRVFAYDRIESTAPED